MDFKTIIMNTLTKIFTPFKKLSSKEELLSTIGVIILIFSIWTISGSEYIPRPIEIIKSFPRLMEKDIIRNFMHSLGFCFTAIFYAFLIAIVACYLSVLPIFRTLANFLRKFRFLPSTGLSFLFMAFNFIGLYPMLFYFATSWLKT